MNGNDFYLKFKIYFIRYPSDTPYIVYNMTCRNRIIITIKIKKHEHLTYFTKNENLRARNCLKKQSHNITTLFFYVYLYEDLYKFPITKNLKKHVTARTSL